MKRTVLASMVVCGLLAFAVQSQALMITPGSSFILATGVTHETETPRNSTPNILAVVIPLVSPATELYKFELDGNNESGPLSTSYQSSFPSDSGGTISYTGGLSNTDSQYLLVKDGNQAPWWYLFDLTAVWDGTESLVLSDFWPGNGAISHVALYGTEGTVPPVPEPGTLLLLGSGLAGLAWYSRKRKSR